MRIDSFREGATLALDQLRANKFRSGLTILGIVVGVATVMAMSAMIQGIRTSVLEEFDAAGPANFYLGRFDPNQVSIVSGPGDGPPWGDNPAVTVSEVRKVGRLPAVRRTIVGLDLNGEFRYGNQRVASVSIAGRETRWTDFTKATIVAGHDMLPNDVRSSSTVVLLTKPLAESLFGTLDPIGRQVRISGIPFEVIGVFELGNNLFASMQENLAIMPYTSAIKHLDAWVGMLGAFVVTAPGYTQAQAMDQVVTTLRVSRGLKPADPNNFALVRQEQMAEMFNRFTGVFFMVMLALSSVALMVGGVGVVAIMMIAVTERTREIGIRKALGATRREILWQFLFEAVTVTVIGAVIGMLIGGGTAFLVATATPIPAAVPLSAVVAALAMATFAGIVCGIWPAWRAARMDPVVALRYE
jgi:putative ABC transport system permease protein